MKINISCIATAIVATLAVSACQNPVTNTDPLTAAKDTVMHTMLHADANTIYFDTAGNKSDSMYFMKSLKTGRYTFEPDVKDGKVISIKLKVSEQKVTMGSMAPEFSGTGLNGRMIDLKALKGKTVILNFWFTGCAPCKAEMPELNGLVSKYTNDPDVVFIAITYNSPEQVNTFLKHQDFKFNILAGRSDIINQYSITGYPTSIVIDKSGNIAFSLTSYDGTNVAQLDGVIGALKKI